MDEPANTVKTRDELGRLLPGVSGNPRGRPKTVKVREVAKAYLEEAAESGDKTRLELLVARLEKDDPKTLLAYAYGKPVETVELSGADGEPLFPDALIVAAAAVAKTLQ